MVTLGDSAGTQTQDPQLRRLLLYSAELPNQHLLASAKLMLYFDMGKILTLAEYYLFVCFILYRPN